MAIERISYNKNSRLYMKDIDLIDAYGLQEWGMFKDPWMKGYNYGKFSDAEVRFWYMTVTATNRKYFSVMTKNEDRFIGFIGLKKINWFTKTSKLGIVFDPNYISQGYGYEAMDIFLDYYFYELKFRELRLDVNDFNDRAINLYHKLGFVEEGKTIEVFENQEIEVDPKYFELHRGLVYSKITKMKIRKDDR